MTQMIMLPETAPFSQSQRAWLNGFLNGLLQTANNAAVMATGAARSEAAATPAAPVAAAPAEEEFPWHDPALPLDERMKLAEGKPPARQLMAAMAQLDCGTCGYDCKTYAEAITDGGERT